MSVTPAAVTDVEIAPLPIERFRDVLDESAYGSLMDLRRGATELLAGRAVWCVNSTARGGGVAEMLRSLLAYTRGAGVDTRWAVIGGGPDFFRVTKRLHNRLHGTPCDGGPLGAEERAAYDETLEAAARELAGRVQRDDIVVLHDPQTAGLSGPMHELGARVVWRAHIGVDEPNDLTREAWDFLRPALADAEAYIFSRESFVWSDLNPQRVTIIPPSIDVFSPKNQELEPAAVRSILTVAGLAADGPRRDAVFMREDGTPGRVERSADMIEERPLRGDEQVVTQVSRWDSLKDPVGVLQGFLDHTTAGDDSDLVLAGPAVEAVSDDPEGATVLAQVVATWQELPQEDRARVHIACLPMDDPEENAAIVNALQRRSDVVVQKSLAEGFGLTVAEAMWKARPMVASDVGGIRDQVIDGHTGVLLRDPSDLAGFGRSVRDLLADPDRARRLGAAAQARVRDHFLQSRHLDQWATVVAGLIAEG